jgi:hypothetical protein
MPPGIPLADFSWPDAHEKSAMASMSGCVDIFAHWYERVTVTFW